MINFLNGYGLLGCVKLSEIGERKLIERICDMVDQNRIFTGDDCAYISIGNEYLLLTTDMIQKKTHIPEIMKPEDIGWFISAINLSDIAAMGGEPLGLLIALGAPRDTEESFVLDIMKGVRECAHRYKVPVIGGDTKEHEEITLAGTAVGRVPKEEIMLRRGMMVGDILAVTGTLGKAGAGYLATIHGIENILPSALIRPTPRIEEGKRLRKFATSCIDLSDGLASSLYQLKKINGFGFELEDVPVDDEAVKIAEKLDIDPLSVAAYYGGDYELLVTIPENSMDKAKEVLEKGSLIPVGKVVKDGDIVIMSDGKRIELKDLGYEHFKNGG